jgi:anti-sigma factor RsiW
MTLDGHSEDVDLHAYLDGALDAVHSRAVEARLAADPELAARLAAFKADKMLLRQIFGPLTERPLPPEWTARLATSKPRRLKGFGMPLAGAIAAALLLALASYYPIRHSLSEPEEIVAAALRERALATSQQNLLVSDAAAPAYDKLLSNIVGAKVKVPDMRKLGYRLTAIALRGDSSVAAADIIYRDDSGRLVTLYVRHSDGHVRFDQFMRAGLRVCIWQDDQVAMVMAGDVSTAAMQRLASLAYSGLST